MIFSDCHGWAGPKISGCHVCWKTVVETFMLFGVDAGLVTPSVPDTNIALKIDGWKMKFPFDFQGGTVSFRECLYLIFLFGVFWLWSIKNRFWSVLSLINLLFWRRFFQWSKKTIHPPRQRFALLAMMFGTFSSRWLSEPRRAFAIVGLLQVLAAGAVACMKDKGKGTKGRSGKIKICPDWVMIFKWCM